MNPRKRAGALAPNQDRRPKAVLSSGWRVHYKCTNKGDQVNGDKGVAGVLGWTPERAWLRFCTPDVGDDRLWRHEHLLV